MAITTNFYNFSFNNPLQTLDSIVKGRILPNPHERIIKTKIPRQLNTLFHRYHHIDHTTRYYMYVSPDPLLMPINPRRKPSLELL